MIGYANHKIILDESGIPCDYEFIEVNKAFEELTGLLAADIIGKTATQLNPNIKSDEFDWVACYGEVAMKETEKEFEHYSKILNKWFKINVYSPKKEYFITVFTEITSERNQIEELNQISLLSEELLRFRGAENDFQKITDKILEVANAKFAAFNLYEKDGTQYATITTSGNVKILEKASKILNINIKGKKWNHDPVRDQKIKDNVITIFPNLQDLSGDAIPANICKLITKAFDIGQVILVKIEYNNKMLGDFTLFMQKGKSFNKSKIVEIFAQQLGLTIARTRAEDEVKEINRIAQLGRWDYYHIDNKLIWSDLVFEIFGIDPEHFEVSYDAFMERIHPDDRKTVDDAWVNSLVHKNPYTIDHRIVLNDGSIKWIHEECQTKFSDEGNPLHSTGIVQDITKRKLMEDEIKYLSFHDYLTGLYNRRFYEEKLEFIDKEENWPLSIVIGDVDGLKKINDTFGHVSGDQLLIKTAKAIRKACRPEDIFARTGGDEFAILLPKTDAIKADEFVGRIKDFLKDESVEFHEISVSFGCDTKTCKEDNTEIILKKAEDAMYRNKRSGRSSDRGRFSV